MQIGKIQINQPLILAPMEEISDLPFRMICKRLGADIVYTEFTSCEALIRDVDKAWQKVRIDDAERPVGIQLFGSVADSMAEAVRRLEKFQPDFIDINAGCWARDLVKRGEGAGLLRDIKNFERIAKALVKTTSIPITAKTRLGWDDDNIIVVDVAKMLEQVGVQAIAVHCRTRNQGYKGQAEWSWLEKIKKAVAIPVFGNGDVKTPEDAQRMLATGCDGVMIGRAALQNPWIFCQTKHFLEKKSHLPDVTIKERILLCKEHLDWTVRDRGPLWGVVNFRKHFAGYLKGIAYGSHLRLELMNFKTSAEIHHRLDQFLDAEEYLVIHEK